MPVTKVLTVDAGLIKEKSLDYTSGQEIILYADSVVNLNTVVGITLPFNTVEKNTITGSSIAAGVVTLPVGEYEVSYKVNGERNSGNRKNAVCVVRKNGATNLSATNSFSYVRNGTDSLGTNTLVYTKSSANLTLAALDTLEVFSYRGGSAGIYNLLDVESIFKIRKL